MFDHLFHWNQLSYFSGSVVETFMFLEHEKIIRLIKFRRRLFYDNLSLMVHAILQILLKEIKKERFK